ncbi:37S ribosomal protein S23 mitochondrial [Rhizoclosmatium hyalinum]|nr:37S ribosomal protein S23 mitochondrial [Rhizoclosmatium hyalinum]
MFIRRFASAAAPPAATASRTANAGKKSVASGAASKATTATVSEGTTSATSAATTTTTTTTIKLPEWTPKFATKDKHNTLFALPQTAAAFAIKNSFLNSTQQLAKTRAKTLFRESTADAVLLRDSWLAFVHAANAELAAPESKNKLVLDARPGAGKSAFLNLAASHFRAFDYIVLHFQNIASWTSGLEPYARAPDSDLFTQSAFTAVVLKQIADVNASVLDKITVKGSYSFGNKPFSGTLSQLLAVGINNEKNAQKVLESFMNELLEFPENRPPVLFSFDQVNALYTNTAYFDEESKPIHANKLALLRPFIQLLTRPTVPKACILAATDQTTTQIKSPFLNHLISQKQQQQHKDASSSTSSSTTTTSASAENLSEFSSFGNALVSKEIAPAIYDPVTFMTDVHPVGVVVHTVPEFQVNEAYALVDGLKRAGKLQVSRVSDEFVQKAVMVTKGNARELLKYCV